MTLQQPEALQFTIGAQRQEVMFKDGSAIILLPVFETSVPCQYHRAVKLPKGMTLIFDLRQLAPQIGADICVAQPRDVAGIVFYTLRHQFANAGAAISRISACGVPFVDQAHREAA